MRGRSAFTLFELILAIALSATLLALIGTAVNLYLVRMDSGRTRVEEAQLARSILSSIAADVRATTVYQTQDVSKVAQLALAAKAFDPDAIDKAGAFDASSLAAAGNTGSTNQTGGTTSGTQGSKSSSSKSQSSNGTPPSSQNNTTTLAPGLNGQADELNIDVVRLPRLEELFPAVPQQTATSTAATANTPRPSDLKTIRYFIRQGTAIDPSDPAATRLGSDSQQGVAGLVRQSIDRAVRQVAEQSGDSQLLNSGQELLAPEVTQIQFIFFDGTTAVDTWNMQERGAMPTAVEVRIWLASDAAETEQSNGTAPESRMYSETIELPLAKAAGNSAKGANAQNNSTPQESDDSSTTDPSSSSQGTSFGT